MEEAVWWCSLVVAGNCLLQLDSRQKIHKVVFTKYVFTMEQFRDIANRAPNEASISPAPESNPKLRLVRHPQYVANLSWWRIREFNYLFLAWLAKKSIMFRRRRYENAINCVLKLIA